MKNEIIFQQKSAAAVMAVAFLAVLSNPAGSIMSMAYWEGAQTEVQTVDWTTLTHLIYVAAAPNANGALNPNCWNGCAAQATLVANTIASAHAAGVKVIFNLVTDNGAGNNWASATNSSNLN